MSAKNCVAMILAGGRGEKLGALTHFYPKSTLHFGGNSRIIDFTLNNCFRSRLAAVGILSQYLSVDLHAHLCAMRSTVPATTELRPLPSRNADTPYTGTVDAVRRNLEFIERFNPSTVLLLPDDHIYHMDYRKMISFHEEKGADITIAATPMPAGEASRFRMLYATGSGYVLKVGEKAPTSMSSLASMGIYLFSWNVLKRHLLAGSYLGQQDHEFSGDVIPSAVSSGEAVYAYRFNGYWRDVSTIESLWKANMDQIDTLSGRRSSMKWEPSRKSENPSVLLSGAEVQHSILSDGCTIAGKVAHCVLSDSVTVSPGAEIINSVVMPNVYLGSGTRVSNAIIGTNALLMDGVEIGVQDGEKFLVDHRICSQGVSVVAPWMYLSEGMRFQAESHICRERLAEYGSKAAANDRTCSQDAYPLELNVWTAG